MKNAGTALGFVDDGAATARPMTPEDWRRWYGIRQGTVMIAHALDQGALGYLLDELYERETEDDIREREIDNEFFA